MNTPSSVLKRVFGYDTYRPLQREVIEHVLARRDTLAVMPTGGGKSLCYQIPALIFDGLTVVVSPLIALMKDQVEQLAAAGVPALFLNSTLAPDEYQANMEAVRRGEVRLLYVAPETLCTQRLLGLLSEVRVDCLTIDEAHCISEWGHDFRPEYRQLADVRARFPGAVCLALTATATERVRADIERTLRFEAANVFVASFDRPNLFIEVAPRHDSARQLLAFLERFDGQSGIVYCFSRSQVDRVAAYLSGRGHAALPYHAGLEDGVRRRNQEAFIRDDCQVMVATIAFGMGINKPDVRFVVHHDLPKSLENYYQEIGRAGRDGLPAHCLLLYSYSDVAKLRYFIDQKEGDEREVAERHLQSMTRYAEDLFTCRRRPLLSYFGETYGKDKCGFCDTCTSAPPELVDVTVQAQKFLSCVVRTGERFGAGHVTDVLLGSEAEKVLKYRHHELSTHGVGRELKAAAWMHLARQLTQQGYLVQEGEYRTLCLTPKGQAALRDRTPIMGTPFAGKEGKVAKVKTDMEYDQALFDLLRAERKRLADEAGVPPYVVFPDRTLAEMAACFPQTRERLLTISGVGETKARRYGGEFLEMVRAYCRERDIAEKPSAAPVPARRGSGGLAKPQSVGERYNAGTTLDELARADGVKPQTVIDNLARYVADGNRLRRGDDLAALVAAPPELQDRVYVAFDETGVDYLKPAFERLAGAVTYDDLKVLRLLYLSR